MNRTKTAYQRAREQADGRNGTHAPKDSANNANTASHDGGLFPWADPIPLPRFPAADPWPDDVLPQALSRYSREAAAAIHCPADYVAVPLLVMAGAAIGASRQLAITGSHKQRASLYAAVIAPPGGGKSPAQEMTTDQIHEAEDEMRAEWEARVRAYETELAEYEAAKKRKQKNPDEVLPDEPRKPVLPRLTVDDFTVESLVGILQENPRGVAVASDEISAWAARMNQYRSGGQGADRQFFLSAWSGATYTYDRKGSRESGPVRLRRPFLAVVGGIPPAKLRTLRGDRPHQRGDEGTDDGFLDRILLSYPDPLPAVEEDWAEVAPETLQAVADVFKKLRTLMMVPYQQGLLVAWRPFLVRLTPAGRTAWKEFTRSHAEELNDGTFPDHLRGVWSKMRGYCGRLALLVHYLRWACGEVTSDTADVDGESVRRAAALVAYFKSHARKVYAAIEADAVSGAANKVIRWLRKQHLPRCQAKGLPARFSTRQAFEALKGTYKTVAKLEEVLSLVERHGYIRPTPTAARPGPGRPPSPTYDCHPSLYRPASQNSQNSQNGRKRRREPDSANNANTASQAEDEEREAIRWADGLTPAEQAEALARFDEGIAP